MINVKVLFFGAAKEIVGAAEKDFELPPNAAARDAFELILRENENLRDKFGKSLLFAVNQTYVGGDEIIQNNDEIAVFPPVSGGSPESQLDQFKINNDNEFFEITFDALDVGEIARRVIPSRCGATVTLDGYVRQWTKERETLYLVYEGYEPMALSEMQKLGAAVREQFEVSHIGIVHRLGRLEIGETSVVIAVAAPHRRAAFAACEWLIKELKRTVPIWKKEFYADGEIINSEWIAGENSAV